MQWPCVADGCGHVRRCFECAPSGSSLTVRCRLRHAFHVRSLLCCPKALQLGVCCILCCLEVIGLQVQNARHTNCLQVLEIYEVHGETTVRVVTATIPCVPQRRQGARNVF